METADLLATIAVAEEPSAWSALGQRGPRLEFHVATDGDGYHYAWVTDLKVRIKDGWIPFESQPLLLDVLAPAIARLARVHDEEADVGGYDWRLRDPIALPDFPLSGDVLPVKQPVPATLPVASPVIGSCVYVLESAGYYKIGVTGRDPLERIKDMQTGNPFPIVLVGMFPGDEQTESYLHKKFSHRHLRGEWFDLSGDLAA